MKTDMHQTNDTIRTISDGSKYGVKFTSVAKYVTSDKIRTLTPADLVIKVRTGGSVTISYNSKRMATRRAILLENDGPRKESTE